MQKCLTLGVQSVGTNCVSLPLRDTTTPCPLPTGAPLSCIAAHFMRTFRCARASGGRYCVLGRNLNRLTTNRISSPKMNAPLSAQERAVAMTDSLMTFVDGYAKAYADHGFAPKEWKALHAALLRALTNEHSSAESSLLAGAETVAQTERSVVATDAGGIHIWTDGACEPNPGRGGWGAIIINGVASREIFGGERQSTNNRMEFIAALKALELVDDGTTVTVFTDSMLLVKTASDWMHSWRKRGWTRKNGAAIANLDLVKALASECTRLKVTWKHVKAHSGIALNERADWLANKGRRSIA